MLKIRKQMILLIILLIAVSNVSGCAKQQENMIVVATQFEIPYGVLFVMQEKGIFEKHLPSNTKVEYVQITGGGSAVREALQSGSAHFAGLGLPPIASCWDQNSPLSIITGLASNQYYVYSNSPDIQTLEDIGSDDKIAVLSIGGTYHILLSMCAKALFGDEEKFENNIMVLPQAEALIAMQSGQVQAWVVAPPYTNTLDNYENMQQIANISEVLGFQYSLTTVALKDFADENPDICKAFSKSIEESILFIQQNRDEAVEIISEKLGASAEETSSTIDDYQFSISVSGYDEVATHMYETGLIKKKPTLLKEVMFSY